MIIQQRRFASVGLRLQICVFVSLCRMAKKTDAVLYPNQGNMPKKMWMFCNRFAALHRDLPIHKQISSSHEKYKELLSQGKTDHERDQLVQAEMDSMKRKLNARKASFFAGFELLRKRNEKAKEQQQESKNTDSDSSAEKSQKDNTDAIMKEKTADEIFLESTEPQGASSSSKAAKTPEQTRIKMALSDKKVGMVLVLRGSLTISLQQRHDFLKLNSFC